MQAYQENISAKVNGVLSPILGVKVTVTDDATGHPATLFSDNGVTQITGDIVTDETGYFGFRAANGSYTISFSSPQIRLSDRNIDLYDPRDDAPLTQSQAASPSGASMLGYGQRTIENKLGDVVSVKDFGAKGDWIPSNASGNSKGTGSGTDDTAAFVAAASAARSSACGLYIPSGKYRITSSIDLSGLHVFGAGNKQSVLYASTDQFNVVTTTGITVLKDFGIDGGWDGVTAGLSGNGVSVSAGGAGASAWPYNVHLDNLRIQNVKGDGVLFERGAYSSVMRCKINACGLHGIELRGYAVPDYCTTIQIGAMTTSSDTPNGYGLYMSNAQNINCEGVISENTKGIYATGSDNRAISLRSYYQENTIGGLFWSTGGSGIGLTISGCFGGGHIVQYSPNWYQVTQQGNSNMTESAMTYTGRVISATSAEVTSTTTGGFDATVTSVSLPPGTWDIRATMQTVNGASATIAEAAIQLTTDNTQSGKNRATNTGFNFGSNDLTLNPGTNANLRVNVSDIYQNTGTSNITVYLRGFINISAGTIAYKGAIKAVKL